MHSQIPKYDQEIICILIVPVFMPDMHKSWKTGMLHVELNIQTSVFLDTVVYGVDIKGIDWDGNINGFVQDCSISSALAMIITLVRHKKARFDSKMHGSTLKSPVQHKNARFDTKMPSPACISWHCHYQTPPPPPHVRNIFFPILFQYFVFKNP